jgi:hypothetical protein
MTFFSNTSITQVLFYVVNYQFDASFVYRLIEYSIDEHLVFFYPMSYCSADDN